MNFAAAGVNHVKASLEAREALYLPREAMRQFLLKWKRLYPQDEIVGLCTCNRTEFYAASGDFATLPARLLERFAAAVAPHARPFLENAYQHLGIAGAAHLFRVASGLDSMVIGESEILSQLREAYQEAVQCGTVGPMLRRLMDQALRAGKRARSETRIGEGNVSVASVAAGLCAKVFAHLDRKRLLLIGAGETAELAARHLIAAGVREILIANRTAERAQELARQLRASAIPFDSISDSMPLADIVISAVSVQQPVVSLEMAEAAMKRRDDPTMCFIDLGVPRNMDARIEQLESAILYDIDSLQGICEQARRRREGEIAAVEKLLAEEIQKLNAWYSQLETEELIAAIRRRFEDLRRQEIERYSRTFLPQDQERLERFAESLMKKALHDLTENLRGANRQTRDGMELLEAVRRLFLAPPNSEDEENHE